MRFNVNGRSAGAGDLFHEEPVYFSPAFVTIILLLFMCLAVNSSECLLAGKV